LTTAVEQFVIQLARVSKRGQRYLRWLSRADREDVIAETILKCWEQRESFDAATTSLESWFTDRMREARREYREVPGQVSTERLAELVAHDDVERDAERQRLLEGLTDPERALVARLESGEHIKDIAQELGVTTGAVKASVRKLRRIRDLMPEDRPVYHSPTRNKDDGELAPIDHEIEKMLRRPASERADCPVCWRCCYFLGLTPTNYHPTHHADEVICEVIRATESRKIQIGNGERL
jgi:RNA polymerase sigma factor (sigma-70 family)